MKKLIILLLFASFSCSAQITLSSIEIHNTYLGISKEELIKSLKSDSRITKIEESQNKVLMWECESCAVLYFQAIFNSKNICISIVQTYLPFQTNNLMKELDSQLYKKSEFNWIDYRNQNRNIYYKVERFSHSLALNVSLNK